MAYSVYIMTNKPYGTLYVGATHNLEARVSEHKQKLSKFTKRYGCIRLVYFEDYPERGAAYYREKQLKRYQRDWKINLIERDNRFWEDLSIGWYSNKL